MHGSSRWRTMPVSASFSWATTGQPFMQAGSAQWWQAVVTVCCHAGESTPPNNVPTSRHASSASSPLSEWQAEMQAWQPVQRSSETSKAYSSPLPGFVSGIRLAPVMDVRKLCDWSLELFLLGYQLADDISLLDVSLQMMLQSRSA